MNWNCHLKVKPYFCKLLHSVWVHELKSTTQSTRRFSWKLHSAWVHELKLRIDVWGIKFFWLHSMWVHELKLLFLIDYCYINKVALHVSAWIEICKPIWRWTPLIRLHSAWVHELKYCIPRCGCCNLTALHSVGVHELKKATAKKQWFFLYSLLVNLTHDP